MKKNTIDDYLKPGAIVPVSHDSVRLLINHIKELRKKEKKGDISFKTHIKWDFKWMWVENTSTKPPNLELIFDSNTGKLKSANILKGVTNECISKTE